MRILADAARDLALSAACEDYTGLYELIWEFNTQFPEADEEVRLRAGQVALGGLLRDGLAAVYDTRWLSDQYRELNRSEAEAVIAAPESWQSPADQPEGRYFCFASTDAGEARHFQRDAARTS